MFRILYVDFDEPHPVKCFSPMELAIDIGDTCVLKTENLLEYGRVTLADEEPAAESGNLPRVLRRATLQDQSQASENILFARTAWRRCHEKIEELKLKMRLLKVHYSLDRTVFKVLYTSGERVDFRLLVQKLASELHARIEMRQIGPRNVAALVGGYAPCGRMLCCASWLKEFDNVSMRMAKQQGLALNPGNLNGMCGRLKCCLRYENSCYAELSRGLPQVNDMVLSPQGKGRVVDVKPLNRHVRVLLSDMRTADFDAASIKMLGSAR